MALWGRVRITGLDAVPVDGPLLVVPNHDSQWDPIVVGIALRKRRPLRFLARADLWRIPGLGPILHAMGQIPIERGAGDARALDRAVEALRGGEAICVFPEGRLSRGETLRARSGGGQARPVVPRRAGRAVLRRGNDGLRSLPKTPANLHQLLRAGDGAGEVG